MKATSLAFLSDFVKVTFVFVQILRAHLEKEKANKTNLQLFVLDDVCGGCKQMFVFFSLFIDIETKAEDPSIAFPPSSCSDAAFSAKSGE